MSKAVMISIQPKWCELIASGKKKIEVRKTAPKIDTPFKCYIYETKGLCDTPTFIDEDGHISYRGRGAIIGEFVCDKIDTYCFGNMDIPIPAFDGDSTCWEFDDGYYITNGQLEQTSLTYEELCNYGKGKPLYGLHISDLVIYDTPKELREFRKPCDYGYQCKHCDKATYKTTYLDMTTQSSGFAPCNRTINRPSQSWCYVEPLEVRV